MNTYTGKEVGACITTSVVNNFELVVVDDKARLMVASRDRGTTDKTSMIKRSLLKSVYSLTFGETACAHCPSTATRISAT